jgi:hypothetical protein
MKINAIAVFILFLLSPLIYSDYYPQESYMPRSYENAHLARINYSIGEAYVTRSFEQGWEEAAANLPVFDRDLVGTTDGRLELYLGRLNFLRLDYDSEIILEQAPRIGSTRTTIRVERGGIYLNINQLDTQRDIQIQTPDCGIFILGNGLYRINVYNQGGTDIQVHRGFAEVSGEHRGFNLGSRYAVTMVAGDSYQPPYLVDRYSRDDFGIWNAERNRLINQSIGYRSRYLDSVYAHYEYELSSWGRWMYEPYYQMNIWIPNNPGPQWRPYYRGRWIYHPHFGYVWTSYDSWGWITHHYGRWHWSPNYGWYWLPGNKWSPAWVAWSWTDNYFGWCPLSIQNRPVIVVNNQWMTNYQFQSGLPFNSSSVIVVKRDQLWASKIQQAALSGGEVLKLRNNRISFRGRHPKLVPKFRQVTVINAKGKSVVYKKGGFLSPEKYRVERSRDQKIQKQINRYSSPEKRIPVRKEQENKYRMMQKSKRTYQSFSRMQGTPRQKRETELKQKQPVKRTEVEKRQVVPRTSSEEMKKKTIRITPEKVETPRQKRETELKQKQPVKRTEVEKRQVVPRQPTEVKRQKAVKTSPGKSQEKKKDQSKETKKKQKEKEKKKEKSKKKKDDEG